jgi:hypothetical protein
VVELCTFPGLRRFIFQNGLEVHVSVVRAWEKLEGAVEMRIQGGYPEKDRTSQDVVRSQGRKRGRPSQTSGRPHPNDGIPVREVPKRKR